MARLIWGKCFTLIEMLVVIAIIGVLASMLMPALQKSLKIARATMCSNNLKQIGLTVTYYREDFNNFYPAPWTVSAPWLRKLSEIYLYDGDGAKSYAAYRDDADVLGRCPDREYSASEYKSMTVLADYWMTYGVNYAYFSTNAGAAPRSAAGLLTPSSKVYAADTIGTNNYGHLINNSWSSALPYERHNAMTNTLWADNHVESLRINDFAITVANRKKYWEW